MWVCDIKVCSRLEPHPRLMKCVEREGRMGMAESPRGRRRRRSEIGHLCKRSISSYSPHLKEIYPKAVASSSGLGFFFWGGGLERGFWPFLVFERGCITLEKQKILLSACLEFSKQTWRWPRGMMGSKNMDDIMELWPISCEHPWACFLGPAALFAL